MFKKIFPGLLVATLTGVAAILLSKYIPYLGAVSIALVAGIFVGNLLIKGNKYKDGISFTDKKLLPFTIALMGIELLPSTMYSLGINTAILIIGVMAITIITGYLTSRIFGFSTKLGVLLGCGNAICGSSAILSTTKIIDGNQEDTGLSVAAVNFMGVIGLFLLPLLALFIHYSNTESAVLIGGGLQAVGQVVASGYSVNDEVGTIAVLVKMFRVLMLGPILIMLGVLMNKRKKSSKSTGKFPLPLFIVAFFLLMILNSLGIVPEAVSKGISLTIDVLLPIAMAGIGMNINFNTLRKSGLKILLAEVFIMVIHVGALVGGIMLLL